MSVSGIKRILSSSPGPARFLPASKKARSTEPDSGGTGGQSNKVAVEDLAPGGRQVPQAGARPPEGGRPGPEEGGREKVEQVAGKYPKISHGSKSQGFLPTGPFQGSSSTRYSFSSPGFVPSFIQNHPSSLIYAPPSPTYTPTSPTYAPTPPIYAPTSPT